MEQLDKLFSVECIPSVGYISKLIANPSVKISIGEQFEKQTHRSRFEIAGPNGKQVLSIPLIHQSTHQSMAEVQIDYSQNWQIKHWRSIETAYSKAPFFEFYEHLFRPLFTNNFYLLTEFNLQVLHAILRALKINMPILLDTSYCYTLLKEVETINLKYNQVFIDKNGFISNLSTLDLIFNEGPNAMDSVI